MLVSGIVDLIYFHLFWLIICRFGHPQRCGPWCGHVLSKNHGEKLEKRHQSDAMLSQRASCMAHGPLFMAAHLSKA